MQYAYFDQQIITTRHMLCADLGHRVCDTLRIFRAGALSCVNKLAVVFRKPPMLIIYYSHWESDTTNNA